MSNGKKMRFKIDGYFNGQEINPKNIPMSLLVSFVKDISELIMSYNERSKSDDIIISIEKGSFEYMLHDLKEPEYNNINEDLEVITKNKSYAAVNSKRATIIQSLVNATKKYSGISIIVENEDGSNKFVFDSNSNFSNISNNVLVDSELYLYGEIQDMGGIKNSNIHIRTDEGKNITIDCKKEDLRNDEINRIYKYSGIRVNAKYNIETKEYQDYSFIEFVEYNPVYDEEKIQKHVKQGTKAWEKIKDHNKWLREIRGYE